MPIYEYICRNCGHEFEALLKKMSDAPGPCPKCGSAKLTKKFSPFAVAGGGGKVPDACSSCPAADSGTDACSCCCADE
jgi:putative FmdB family regulatory protein